MGGPVAVTIRTKYEITWNPLGTPVVYGEIGWGPDLEQAGEGILRTLDQYGRRTGNEGEKKRWRAKVWRPGRVRLRVAGIGAVLRRHVSWRLGSVFIRLAALRR